MDREVFCARLRSLREDSDLSQGELAEELGVSRGAVSFYENGDRLPNIDFLYKVCDFFSISPSYLLGFTDEKGNVETIVKRNSEIPLYDSDIEVMKKIAQDGCSFYLHKILDWEYIRSFLKRIALLDRVQNEYFQRILAENGATLKEDLFQERLDNALKNSHIADVIALKLNLKYVPSSQVISGYEHIQFCKHQVEKEFSMLLSHIVGSMDSYLSWIEEELEEEKESEREKNRIKNQNGGD